MGGNRHGKEKRSASATLKCFMKALWNGGLDIVDMNYKIYGIKAIAVI